MGTFSTFINDLATWRGKVESERHKDQNDAVSLHGSQEFDEEIELRPKKASRGSAEILHSTSRVFRVQDENTSSQEIVRQGEDGMQSSVGKIFWTHIP